VSGRRVIVTGGTGFVGATLVRALLAEGMTVSVLSRPGSDRWRLHDVLDAVHLVEVDVRDAVGLARAMQDAKPEWAFHLASHGNSSWQTDAREIFDVVAGGLVNVIAACAQAGCSVLVNAGSSSEYGLKDHPPAESECPEPNSHYAIAKVAATLLGRYESARLPLRIVTLRLYSVYGPWEDPRRLMPALIVRGLQGEWPPLADPETARDYVFAGDVADAFLRAAAGAPAGSVYNVGTGVQTSLREAVDVVARLLSITARPAWGTMANRGWDTATWVADARAVATDLNWRPSHTFEQGCRLTIEWLRSHPELIPRYRHGTQVPRS
jgi:nucleoside-diphosphate-sugar epimerase